MKLKFDCDLEKLVKAFEAAPEKVRQMVRVQMKMAARDIKDLVEKAILEPQEGRVRDVYYGIRCNDSILVIPLPKEPLSD